MINKSKRNLTTVNKTIAAWETMAPDATFAGMTLEEFKKAVQPSLDLQAVLNALLAEVTGVRRRFVDSSNGSRSLALKVAKSVRGDVRYGEDCPLYSALGYIRASERKSGLTRKARAAAAAESPAPSTTTA